MVNWCQSHKFKLCSNGETLYKFGCCLRVLCGYGQQELSKGTQFMAIIYLLLGCYWKTRVADVAIDNHSPFSITLQHSFYGLNSGRSPEELAKSRHVIIDACPS